MKARFYVDVSGTYDTPIARDAYRWSVVWAVSMEAEAEIDNAGAPVGWGPVDSTTATTLSPLTPLLDRLFSLTAAQRRLLRNYT